MSSLLTSKCLDWIDEDGLKVIKIPSPFGGLFYIDEDARELNSLYNPHFKIFDVSKMGSAGLENFTNKICALFLVMQSFGGISFDDLDEFASVYQNTSAPDRLVKMNYMRYKKIAGVKGIFPTEKLIRSCFERN